MIFVTGVLRTCLGEERETAAMAEEAQAEAMGEIFLQLSIRLVV